MAILYRHIRKDTQDIFYIGIGKTVKRAFSLSDRNNHWKNIIKSTDYEVDIIFEDLTWNEACEKEKEFIQIYGRRDLGSGTLVNMTNGGDGANGLIQTEETRKKLSKLLTGRTIAKETKAKLSKYMTGRIGIYKDGKSKYVDLSELQSFIDTGWNRNIIY
jgi:hypothetical protein